MLDAVIVGGGIFGQVAAAVLRRAGMTVRVLDDSRPGAGSPPAGCVLRPSWLTSMTRAQVDDALRTLDENFGLVQVVFTIRPSGKQVPCWRVEPGTILSGPTTRAQVLEVHDASAHASVVFDETGSLTARHVVLACGQWANELAPWLPPVTGRWGWSHRGPPVADPIIRLWAPYRQVVALNLSDGRSWLGDGQSLIASSVTEERMRASRTRCADAAQVSITATTGGFRPFYAKDGSPCLLASQGRVHAITGGAKNGTASAAWAAAELIKLVGGG